MLSCPLKARQDSSQVHLAWQQSARTSSPLPCHGDKWGTSCLLNPRTRTAPPPFRGPTSRLRLEQVSNQTGQLTWSLSVLLARPYIVIKWSEVLFNRIVHLSGIVLHQRSLGLVVVMSPWALKVAVVFTRQMLWGSDVVLNDKIVCFFLLQLVHKASLFCSECFYCVPVQFLLSCFKDTQMLNISMFDLSISSKSEKCIPSTC